MGWDDFGVFPGRSGLKRLWVRAVCYDVLGEQKEVNLTEAGRIFQLGRHRHKHQTINYCQSSLSFSPRLFFPNFYSACFVWNVLSFFSDPSFPMKVSRLHSRVGENTWHISEVWEGGAGPIPVSKGTVMRAERAPGSIPTKEEPSLHRVPRWQSKGHLLQTVLPILREAERKARQGGAYRFLLCVAQVVWNLFHPPVSACWMLHQTRHQTCALCSIPEY